MKKAVFPGSFDPITLGHEDVITRAIPLFDEITIAIGINSNKKYMFSLEQRIKFIEECFQEYDNVKVVAYKGLTVDFCKTHAINYIKEVYEIQQILNLKNLLLILIEIWHP